MKRIAFLILCILFLCGATYTNIIQAPSAVVEESAPAGFGFVGNDDAENNSCNDAGANDVCYASYVCSASGVIDQITGEFDSLSATSMMAIYDSDRNLLRQTVSFEGTGNGIYTVALTSEYTVTADTTYFLGAGNDADAFWEFDGKAGGNTYIDYNGFDGTDMPDPVANDDILDADHTPRIWADNSGAP